jgi:small-conductance mechanosensitive channel
MSFNCRDKYGWINFLGSRYVSVITRDGTEHLIPNETLITGEVINWSYSQNLVRLKVPVGVAYESDLEQVRDLMLGRGGYQTGPQRPQTQFPLDGLRGQRHQRGTAGLD